MLFTYVLLKRNNVITLKTLKDFHIIIGLVCIKHANPIFVQKNLTFSICLAIYIWQHNKVYKESIFYSYPTDIKYFLTLLNL